MGRKKIMILGASHCQVPLITMARELGFEVVVVSIAGDYPGFALADRVCEIDTRDLQGVLEAARREKIDGILTDQTDIAVPTVAFVAEQLGLPGIGYDCALRCTNKFLMRQFCREHGIPVPGFFQAATLEEARLKADELTYPLVLKPVDSQGSRGVIRVESEEDLERFFEQTRGFSSLGKVIVEEYFEGREVVIEGFMADGLFINLVIGDREYFDLPGLFIPRQTVFPSALEMPLQKRLLELNRRLIEAMEPSFCITHSEFLVNEETGEVRLVETAARGGGVFISSDLIPLASGVDVNERLLRLAAGQPMEPLDPVKLENHAAAYLCFCLPEGVIERIEGREEVKKIPGVHKVFIDDIAEGAKTAPMSDKTMRKGPVLVRAGTLEELRGVMDRVRKTLRVTVLTPEGPQPMIW